MYLTLAKQEIGPTLDAHEFIHCELDVDYLNTPYMLVEEEIINMLDERDDVVDNQPIEEVDNVQISDVIIDKVTSKDVEKVHL
jgi:hypothetical protein